MIKNADSLLCKLLDGSNFGSSYPDLHTSRHAIQTDTSPISEFLLRTKAEKKISLNSISKTEIPAKHHTKRAQYLSIDFANLGKVPKSDYFNMQEEPKDQSSPVKGKNNQVPVTLDVEKYLESVGNDDIDTSGITDDLDREHQFDPDINGKSKTITFIVNSSI